MATLQREFETVEDTEFSEAEFESVAFEAEEAEAIQAELTGESTPLENIEFESIAEDMETEFESFESFENFESFEGFEAKGLNGSRRRPPSGFRPTGPRRNRGGSVNKQLLKTFTSIIKTVVKKITTNPKTRTKFKAAVRQGPAAVTRILTQAVSKSLPPYFRWLAPIYVPTVASTLFHPIRTQVGVKREEVESLEGSFEF
ncbi:hypothetical protein [Nostoc sp.]|uniref:hypothetical protein n=1 Tax=Nostoc sp. TaxID=1180 RepID=UPI002FF94371